MFLNSIKVNIDVDFGPEELLDARRTAFAEVLKQSKSVVTEDMITDFESQADASTQDEFDKKVRREMEIRLKRVFKKFKLNKAIGKFTQKSKKKEEIEMSPFHDNSCSLTMELELEEYELKQGDEKKTNKIGFSNISKNKGTDWEQGRASRASDPMKRFRRGQDKTQHADPILHLSGTTDKSPVTV